MRITELFLSPFSPKSLSYIPDLNTPNVPSSEDIYQKQHITLSSRFYSVKGKLVYILLQLWKKTDQVLLMYHNGRFSRHKGLFVHLIDGSKLVEASPHLSTSLWHHSSQGHTIALHDGAPSKGRPPWSCCFEIKLAIVVFTAHDKDKGSEQQGHTQPVMQ